MALPRQAREVGYNWARYGVAGLLLVAAGLKAYQLITGPVAEDGILTSRIFLIAVVEAELLLAAWLIADVYRTWAWRKTIAVFAAFSCVALWLGVSGAESCACFGRLEISPWLSLTIDSFVIAALVVCRPQASESIIHRRQLIVAAGTLAASIPMLYLMASFTPTILSADGVIVGSGNIVVLQPEKWKDQEFPLLPYIECEQDLTEGEWEVWLYRHDCPKCQHRLRDAYNRSSTQVRLALIELPPHQGAKKEFTNTDIAHGRLSTDFDWFVEMPMEMTMVDGRVIAVKLVGEMRREPG